MRPLRAIRASRASSRCRSQDARAAGFKYHGHPNDSKHRHRDQGFLFLSSQLHLEANSGRDTQLSKLSAAGKDQLALLVAQRKVVAFRNQDFAQLSPDAAVDYCSYFGRPVIHPVGPTPAGNHPEIHIAHNGGDDSRLEKMASVRTTSMFWHSDLSGDLQPPGLVFLYMLECPESGGDTSFTNTALAYSKLSPAFQQRLHGLEAEHTDLSIIEGMRATGGVVRREVATCVHPIVRTNPATGEKTLFVNSLCMLSYQFFMKIRRLWLNSMLLLDTTRIIGLKKEESDCLLKFLFDHIAFSQDIQARVRWDEKTVVIFDVRLTRLPSHNQS